MARPGAAMPGTRASTVLATAAGALALVACLASIGLDAPRARSARLRDILIEIEGNPMGNVPTISSSCVTANTACIVAVPGGSLRLTGIHFPHGPGAPGAADAVGYVNGRFVSGTIQLSAQAVHGIDREGHDPAVVAEGGPPAPTAMPAWRNGPPAVQLHRTTPQHKHERLEVQKDRARKLHARRGRGLVPAKNAQKLADVDHDKAAEEQYKAALAAVEGHMKERMDKVEQEATKIAEAVTKVITSPEVSKKIADLAMDAAAAKAGPAAEASETGGVQGGVDGVGQFGYSNEPAGTEGAGCGPGCAGSVATTPDLDTVAMRPPPPPASTAFYAAWKAGGGQTGTVQVPHTVVVQNPAVLPPPLMPATNQPLMPYTLNAAMMGASGFVHGEPLPEDAASVEPVGGPVPEAATPEEGGEVAEAVAGEGGEVEAAEGGVPVQLHQMQQVGVGGSLVPGGAAAQQLSQTGEARTGSSGMGSSMMAQMEAILSSPGGSSAAAQYQVAAQLPTFAQQAPPQAPAQPAAASKGARGVSGQQLADPWGAFSAFQSAPRRQ